MTAVGFAFDAALGPGVSSAVAAEVERLDYASLWTNDTPNAPGLPILAAAQRVTARIPVGVGVIPCDRRSARDVAAGVTNAGLDLRRAVIGIGAGRAERPAAAVREAVDELRRVLRPGAVVAVAAMGPRMCRLAGEIADVVLLNWMTPERIRWARERVREGERRAGRDAGSVVVASYVRVAVGRDARERLAHAAERYTRFPAYARSFAAMRVAPETVGVAAVSEEEARAALAPYREALDETIVRALPTFPTAESVLELARATRP
ncbi:MAG: LLM class flavin-dependent oxidoreductase [Chloroflexota bacterium]|nr:LLM class flavin-dependent oxidoreductase [Chloroflexota bacterium]